ncbi:N-formylglutamate amidohydrolase [Algimonas porphyrae]|uniref:N-formylglutamate amidohydrolase n=1 Tax=Algimonas porphyrae TaxID=1128113 RepID=A0ABQ5V4G8_9PROT|nr:N-formylglutamate amidohydrolase [Algimonas porphyrae]GLQ21501.1 N-formylglutamate amidohydrolase [Algimonas porphyrae]
MTAFHTIDGPNEAVFIFADHASNHVPDWVGDLGVGPADMRRHIAWDIGTETVARTLCDTLSCSGLICGFSRLVVDANRDPDAPGLIPVITDGTDIPANHGLSHAQITARTNRLYRPYHDAIGAALDTRPKALALSIHSFTPQLRGHAPRPTDIGLLVKDDTDTPERFIEQMARIEPRWQVDINQPYSAYDLNFTVDHNVVPRGLRHLAIELRQDHIGMDQDATHMAHILARAIEPLL